MINTIYKGDCLELLANIPNQSIDIVLTDPPYKYLSNQKLETDFNEPIFFSEMRRVLKKNGFIILFGRGSSFYRWNTTLDNIGFSFKEEFVWNKGYCTSPLMSISRVHETISIHTNGKGILNKVKVPYLDMKKHDIDGIITDIKRLKTTFKNTKSLDAVLAYLENNKRDTSDSWQKNNISISSDITKEDRAVSVMRSVNSGMNEKTIIREDFKDNPLMTKFSVNMDERKTGDRACNVMQSIDIGMNEKTIIKENRDHYTAIHPTQKPLALLQRLLRLTMKDSDIVLDPFAGSGSSLIAAKNLGLKYIGIEIDDEYYRGAVKRLETQTNELF